MNIKIYTDDDTRENCLRQLQPESAEEIVEELKWT